MYVQRCIVARSPNIISIEPQQCIPLFLVVGADVAINNIKASAIEMQQWVPLALLSSYKILFTAVDNNKY